ncbi:MAG: hypothetical protein ACXV7H_11825 [Methylobacter sp.]
MSLLKAVPPLVYWLLLTLSACNSTAPKTALLPVGGPPSPTSSHPVATPFLRLETGMHTAMFKSIAVDAGQRYLVTASDDKTARVWDLADGKLL